ncbi:MAG: hypothetical protein P8Y94_07365 [Acidobacteriota bacterium]
MGMARYDGRQWWSYYKEDSGLPSNFINFIRAQGRLAWICTDSGLAVSNGRAWVTYQGAGTKGGQILFIDGKQIQRRLPAESLYPHNFVLGMDFQGRDVWVATEGGVGHGRVDPALGFEVEKAVPAGKSKSDAAE